MKIAIFGSVFPHTDGRQDVYALVEIVVDIVNGPIKLDIVYSTALTEAENTSEFKLMKDTPFGETVVRILEEIDHVIMAHCMSNPRLYLLIIFVVMAYGLLCPCANLYQWVSAGLQ